MATMLEELPDLAFDNPTLLQWAFDQIREHGPKNRPIAAADLWHYYTGAWYDARNDYLFRRTGVICQQPRALDHFGSLDQFWRTVAVLDEWDTEYSALMVSGERPDEDDPEERYDLAFNVVMMAQVIAFRRWEHLTQYEFLTVDECAAWLREQPLVLVSEKVKPVPARHKPEIGAAKIRRLSPESNPITESSQLALF
ncbi:MAG: hypothetical protein IPO08_22760 [Xanthomonadales bacterium]|nr:hypothetical protein [Xanthomonadales bacterium]